MMRRAFPDLQAHIEDIVAAEDKVAVRLRFRGTHRGEFLGIPATGRTPNGPPWCAQNPGSSTDDLRVIGISTHPPTASN